MNMDLANIEKLLEKYLEATTNLQEEALLKTYFTSNNVALHLQEYKSMFQYFDQNQSEVFTKDIRLETKTPKRKWISIAAAVALLFGGYTVVNNYTEQQEAKQAYADTQEAFKLIAFHINKGKVSIKELNTFEQTTKKIFKNKK